MLENFQKFSEIRLKSGIFRKKPENKLHYFSEEAFSKAHETVRSLANDDLAMIPIRLYLEGASSLQHCTYEGAVDLCYEFFTQVSDEKNSRKFFEFFFLQNLSWTSKFYL